MPYDLNKMLRDMVKKDASDLHLTAGHFPQYRVDEKLLPVSSEAMKANDVKRMVYGILTEEQIKQFEEEWELDLSIGIEGVSRFRVNVFIQRGSIGCAIRRIPFDIMNFEECGLPVRVVTIPGCSSTARPMRAASRPSG